MPSSKLTPKLSFKPRLHICTSLTITTHKANTCSPRTPYLVWECTLIKEWRSVAISKVC